MWPFENREKRAAMVERLQLLHKRVETGLREQSGPDELRNVTRELASLALEAPDSITNELGTWELLRRAREYIDERSRAIAERKARAIVDQLRPCVSCKGREYFLSLPVAIDELISDRTNTASPRLRIAVCAACGHVTMWAIDVDEVRKSALFSTRTEQAKGGDEGPFR